MWGTIGLREGLFYEFLFFFGPGIVIVFLMLRAMPGTLEAFVYICLRRGGVRSVYFSCWWKKDREKDEKSSNVL